MREKPQSMFPLLLLIPGALILWSLAKKHGEREAIDRQRTIAGAVERALANHGHGVSPLALPPHHVEERELHPEHVMPIAHPSYAEVPAASANTARYMEHLRESAMAAANLNLVRPAAIAADVNGLLNAPPEAVQALAYLSQPLDVLTVQRDLNMLGAAPALAESGIRDGNTVEAIKAFQARFKQEPTGVVDPSTAVALRYSVGVIYYQNQIGVA